MVIGLCIYQSVTVGQGKYATGKNLQYTTPREGHLLTMWDLSAISHTKCTYIRNPSSVNSYSSDN